MPEVPWTLHLPATLLLRGFSLARLLARDPKRSWSEGYRLLERFELRSHERGFALTLLQRRSNLWLFRCDQRRFCGDFVVVDMSAPRPVDRRVHLLELKQNEPLIVGARGERHQMANYGYAVEHIADTAGIIPAGHPCSLIYGDPSLTLRFFRLTLY